MRRSVLWIVAMSIFLTNGFRSAATTVSPAETKPVVRAVLFWIEGCLHCHEVIDRVLPPLKERYGSRLEIALLQIDTEEKRDRFSQVATFYGFSPGEYGVPFLIIGNQVLMGFTEISSNLPALIEKHLAAGGIDYPQLEVLASMLPISVAEETYATSSKQAHSSSSGFTLAYAILVGMVAAIIYAIVVIVRYYQGIPPRQLPAWGELAVPFLSLIGLGVAFYLAYVETQAVPAFCGPVGDCNTVQSSPYAKILGILPLGVLGAMGYVGILAVWFWGRLRSDKLAVRAPLAVFAMTLFGVLFSLYLTYLEIYIIRAVCIWCLISAIVMTLLSLLSVGQALQIIDIVPEENS